MARCTATAKILKDAEGQITEAYISCPEEDIPGCGPCKPGFSEEKIGGLTYEVHFCFCDPEKEYPRTFPQPGKYRPAPHGCHMELTLVKKGKQVIAAIPKCVGGCPAGEKCPDKPKKTEKKGSDGSVAETYECPCEKG